MKTLFFLQVWKAEHVLGLICINNVKTNGQIEIRNFIRRRKVALKPCVVKHKPCTGNNDLISFSGVADMP